MKTFASLCAALCLFLLGLLLLAGCSGLQGTEGLQYISGDGQILQIEPAGRDEPIELTGTSLTGDPVDSASYLGKPLVINVWWSGCVPCRTEMPMLVAAEKELRGTASFLGINIRDLSDDAAIAFAEAKGADYPSLYDPTGKSLLAFSGDVSPRSPPTTLVLDAEGRVAVMINGPIPSQLTLTELVKQIAAEDG